MKTTKKAKKKIRVHGDNIYAINREEIAPNLTLLELWASKKDSKWTQKALKTPLVAILDHGDGYIVKTQDRDGLMSFHYCELDDLVFAYKELLRGDKK